MPALVGFMQHFQEATDQRGLAFGGQPVATTWRARPEATRYLLTRVETQLGGWTSQLLLSWPTPCS